MGVAMILASFGSGLVATFIIVLSLLLIGLVLLQKNKGGGLSGAFGGVGGYSAFGTKTGDFLTWLTCGVTAVFLLFCVIGNWVFVFEPVENVNPATPSGQMTPGQTPPSGNRPAGARGPTQGRAAQPGKPGATPNPSQRRAPQGSAGATKITPIFVTPTAPDAAKPGGPAAQPPPSTQPGK